MLKRFSHGARQVVLRAVQQARLRGQTVEPEHLLLALAEAGELVAMRALEEMGISADDIAAHLPALVAEPPKEDPPFSPAAKRVLEASVKSAKQLGHSYIRSEHLLLALADEDTGGQAASILKAIGVDLAALKRLLTEQASHVPYRPAGQGGWFPGLWGWSQGASTPRDWVVGVRLDEPTLLAVDGLVRAGVARSRSEAVYLLCRKGIEAHRELFERLAEKMASVAEIEREMRRIFSGQAEGQSSGQAEGQSS